MLECPLYRELKVRYPVSLVQEVYAYTYLVPRQKHRFAYFHLFS